MPGILIDLDYFTHPKVLKLADLLGKGAEVLPIRLWCHTGKHHGETGRLTGYSAKAVEQASGWWGKSGRCADAMVSLGLLESAAEGGFLIHDWAEWQGHLLDGQDVSASALRMRRHRHRKRNGDATGDAESDAAVTFEGVGVVSSSLSSFSSENQIQKDKYQSHQSAPNLGAARGIADAYRLRVTAAHGFRGAKEVRALLAAGEATEAQLLAAVEHAAAWYEREGRAAEKRPACWTFFGSEEWRGFVEAVPPPSLRGATSGKGAGRLSAEEMRKAVMG